MTSEVHLPYPVGRHLNREPHLLALILAVAPVVAPSSDLVTHRVPVAAAETLAVTVAGSGPPVVLIPGLFGSAFVYRHLIRDLAARGHRPIVIEPLGVGRSGRPKGADYSFSAQADRIAEALTRLEIDEPVTIVAHSVSGTIALRLALNHPGRVAAVVSIEGGPLESAATPGLRAVVDAGPLMKFGGAGAIRRVVRQGLVDASADPAWITDEVIESYTSWATGNRGASLAAYAAMIRARDPSRLGPALSTLTCPVRLVVGGAPHKSGPSAAEIDQLRRTVPNFAAIVIDNAGHHVHEERPAELVEAIIAARAGNADLAAAR